jgi:predicted oxidoreductase
MKEIDLGKTGLLVPAVALGFYRTHSVDIGTARVLIETALDIGVNFFEHADVYGDGASEEIFAAAADLSDDQREKVFIQSKCGIIKKRCYDFSKAHILEAVDGSLRRLRTDYLDVLLLHRPDALVEPEEVAEAFQILYEKKKVRHFGVSNMNPYQIELLKKYVKQPLVANQLQLSLANAHMVSSGIFVNRREDAAIDRDGGVLDYCRLHDISIQCWSPVQYSTQRGKGTFLDSPDYAELNAQLAEFSERYGVPQAAIAAAWLLRHPAKMQVVAGTTNAGRLKDIARASEVDLTREEWYELWMASGYPLP